MRIRQLSFEWGCQIWAELGMMRGENGIPAPAKGLEWGTGGFFAYAPKFSVGLPAAAKSVVFGGTALAACAVVRST
jgi:hypothetical protein